MVEFGSFSFKNAVTYGDKLTTIDLKNGGAIYIGGINGAGKAQPLHSLIKVPNGWKRMGDIEVGNTVCTPDGGLSKVIKVFPQGVKDVYKITFEDGRSTECCEDHLWKVSAYWLENGNAVTSLRVIKDKDFYRRKLYIDLINSIYSEDKELPIDPYVLGFLIGDGCISGRKVLIFNADQEIIDILESKLIDGYHLHKCSSGKYAYAISRNKLGGIKKKGKFVHYYREKLNELHLLEKRSWEKFVPEIYREASQEQRLDILRGLMDTDGSVSLNKGVYFTTTSYQLALDIQYLVRSLGGFCRIKQKKSFYKYKNERRQVRDFYELYIKHQNADKFFKLSRKKERALKSIKANTIKLEIKSIEYVGSEQCQCIMIDDPNHLYITDDFIVTHNSFPFNVLHNVLFGYTPLSGKKGTRKLIANQNYYAKLNVSVDKVPYEITQFFNNETYGDGYSIKENGKPLKIAGGIPECEKKIASILPFSQNEFCSFYYLTQDSFHVLVSGKGSERLAYLSEVFNLDIYDAIRTKLKEKLDAVDHELADVVRAQEDLNYIKNKLLEYPSLEILTAKHETFSDKLNQSKAEKVDLDKSRSTLEVQIRNLERRNDLKKTIEKYGSLRDFYTVTSEIEDSYDKKTIAEKSISDWKSKEKLLLEIKYIKDYLKYDEDKVSKALDTLNEEKGKSEALNRDFNRRQKLLLEVKSIEDQITYEEEVLRDLDTKNGAGLIKDRAEKERLESDLFNLSDLTEDGGKCSRCGSVLDADHIKQEVDKLKNQIKNLKESIKEKVASSKEYSDQISLFDKLDKTRAILNSISYTGDEVDIDKLSNKIESLRLKLLDIREAKRIRKELAKYDGINKTSYTAALKVLSDIDKKLPCLQKELGDIKEKSALLKEFDKIPNIDGDEKSIRKELKDTIDRISILEESIPSLAIDEAQTKVHIKVVKDYTEQLISKQKIASKLETLNSKRKITNACWKAQPLHSLIKIPNGWKRMGDMCVGDSVSTPDGGTASVTGVFPQGVKDVYKITFEDGRSTECCSDHLWKVFSYAWDRKRTGREKILTLKDIIEWKFKHKTNLYIPLVKDVYGDKKDLPIDPYVLGCLLGDAHFGRRSIKFTNIDMDVLKTITDLLKDGYCLKKIRRVDLKKLNTYCLVKLDTNKGIVNYYNKSLVDLDLCDKKAWEKFVPEIYREASQEQRLDILRGLMDTDGSVSLNKGVYFTTTSYQLALDIQYLVRSLGGLCKISFRKGKKYFYKGKEKIGRDYWDCLIRHSNPETFFRLSRKKERAKRSLPIILRSKIKSIEYVGSEQCQCIMIDDPNHLYITDDFIVTHNSYAPSNLKKIEMTKITNLIADKLNIFVPLVFNENISFTTDQSENSIDILFRRFDQEPRDIRFLNGGHKKRFLISLIPTLAGLVSVKKRSNIIILDEIDANVDQAGRDAIGEFLIPYLKTKFETVIVISPSSYIDNQLLAPIPLDHFDKILLAECKDGISSLREI